MIFRTLIYAFLSTSVLFSSEYLIKDDLDGQVQEQKNIKNPLISNVMDTTHKKSDLHVIFSYMAVGQYDVNSEESGAGDRYNLIMHYTPTSGVSFGTKLELENKFTDNDVHDFKNNIGSYNILSPGYANYSPYVKELWGQYSKESLVVRAGIINTSSFIDRSFYNNFIKFFMSHASASHSYGLIPLSSLGVGMKYQEKDFYVNAVLSDATQALNDAVGDIRDGELTPYKTVEFGLTPDKNIYFINLWSKEDKNHNKSHGFYLSLNQYLSEKNKVFFKYGKSHNTSTKQHASLGFSHSHLFHESDLFLASFTTAQSSTYTSEYQNYLELLYKYRFDNGIELSGDLQVIQNLTTGKEWAFIPGARFTMVF